MTWALIPARLVASRERSAVLRFLNEIPHQSVVDIPTGTGKLAKVFSKLSCDVVALDISEEMLGVAKASFAQAQHTRVVFDCCDAEELPRRYPGPYDVCVCLRLLHRVPTDIKVRILDGLARVARHTIVSFGLKLWHEPLRSVARRAVFGTRPDAYCEERMPELLRLLNANYETLGMRRVVPGLSREMIFLLRSKRFGAAS
jgi:SAM-dependent methyltransferase